MKEPTWAEYICPTPSGGKWWAIRGVGSVIHTQWGAIGQKPHPKRHTAKDCGSPIAATRYAMRLMEQKKAKGYTSRNATGVSTGNTGVTAYLPMTPHRPIGDLGPALPPAQVTNYDPTDPSLLVNVLADSAPPMHFNARNKVTPIHIEPTIRTPLDANAIGECFTLDLDDEPAPEPVYWVGLLCALPTSVHGIIDEVLSVHQLDPGQRVTAPGGATIGFTPGRTALTGYRRIRLDPNSPGPIDFPIAERSWGMVQAVAIFDREKGGLPDNAHLMGYFQVHEHHFITGQQISFPSAPFRHFDFTREKPAVYRR